MGRIYYNKLIRDRIPEKIAAGDEQCETRVIADDAEFEQELLKKVAEEAGGLARSRSREDFLHEYADLMVVLDALTATLGFSEADINVALKEGLERKGGFSKRLFLEWSDAGKYESDETPQGLGA